MVEWDRNRLQCKSLQGCDFGNVGRILDQDDVAAVQQDMTGKGRRLESVPDNDDLLRATGDSLRLREIGRDATAKQRSSVRIVVAGVRAGVLAPAATGDLGELVIGKSLSAGTPALRS